MTISVLISVYKSEHPQYLDQSLTSVWTNQVLKPDEIVLVQDGPLHHELYNIINKWKIILKDKLRLINNETNLGLTKSLNKGLSVIQSDLIARMDSDDIADPMRFKIQCDFLEKNPEIYVVGTAIQEFNDSNINLGIRYYPRDTQEAIKSMYKANPIAHPSVMIRREVFDKGLKYNERYRTSQDLALWFDIILSGYAIYNLQKPLLYFRRDDAVFKRRAKLKDSFLELKIHEAGIYKLYGFSPYKSLFPIFRFIFRLLPNSLIRSFYDSQYRNKVLR